VTNPARPLVVDCDPGIDDAVALLVAAASPQVDLVGVTTVCGNVDLRHTTRNALAVLALAGRDDVPVAPGADRPLVRAAPRRAEHVHGDGGLGNVALPDPARSPEPVHAVEFLAETVRRSAHPVTLVAVGPLTNVALFYALHPAEAARLARVVVLAGSVGAGNTTPAAEFNAWFDPEAAHRVLTDPGLPLAVPTVQIGLEITYQTAVDAEHLGRMRASGQVGALVADALGHYLLSYRELLGRDAVPIHDAVAVAEAVSPGLVTTQRAHVDVDCGPGPSRGSTVIDLRLAPDAPATAEVGVDVDVPAVADLITDRVASYGGGA
jgi:pyrimidine-specific ribonucleoside hydrolase